MFLFWHCISIGMENIFSFILLGLKKREIPAFMYFKSFITSLTSILISFAFSLFLLIGHRRSVDRSMSSTILSSGNSIVCCLWLDDLVVFAFVFSPYKLVGSGLM